MSKIILVGGGSASGKTFIVNSIINKLGDDDILHISLDDFYNDNSYLKVEERDRLNYDDPSSFDWDLIYSCLLNLKDNNKIFKPIYDFKIHNRLKEKELILPKKIILVDGIMSLVKPRLVKLATLKIFVYAPNETRLIRRLNRDIKERGRSEESILNQYFNTVLPMHQKYIDPSKYNADLILNNSKNNDDSINILLPIIKDLLNN